MAGRAGAGGGAALGGHSTVRTRSDQTLASSSSDTSSRAEQLQLVLQTRLCCSAVQLETMPDMEICAECNRQIEDQYVLRVGDSSLHQDCLKCAACRAPLTDSCFSKFGQFYCKQDFYRLFGPRCSVCQQV